MLCYLFSFIPVAVLFWDFKGVNKYQMLTFPRINVLFPESLLISIMTFAQIYFSKARNLL